MSGREITAEELCNKANNVIRLGNFLCRGNEDLLSVLWSQGVGYHTPHPLEQERFGSASWQRVTKGPGWMEESR